MIETVTVDKDSLDFLRAIYFGAYKDPYEAASNRAYRDMNRTIRIKGLDAEKRNGLRSGTTDILRSGITRLIESPVSDQTDLDHWHCEMCSMIREKYRGEGVEFTYGQAQKWLNMTCKYLYIIGETDFKGVFDYLHIPLDNYIFDVAKKELGIPRPLIAWSRWDDYDLQYMTYQNMMRSGISEVAPLRWEFRYWLKEARER